MRPSRSRRAILQLAGTALAGSLAGCGGEASDDLMAVTPAPVRTDTPRHVASAKGTSPALSPSQLWFDVTILAPFSGTDPARLEISVRNRADARIAARAESRFVLPFVDPDYAGTDPAGDPGLALIPRNTGLIVEPEGAQPQWLVSLLPDQPVDGCWRLPLDWPPAFQPQGTQLRSVSLAPGKTRRHEYELYFIGDCTTGTFTFENTFDLVVGRPPNDGTRYRARLGFVLTVTDSQGIRVGLQTPALLSPPRGDDQS